MSWAFLTHRPLLLRFCCEQLLSLGDEYLDAPLQGGLGEGITELVGESACGKTQLGMQLLLQVSKQQQAAESQASHVRASLVRPDLTCFLSSLSSHSVNCPSPKAVSMVAHFSSQWKVSAST